MTQSKSEWRRDLLAARRAIPELQRRRASDCIASRVCGLQAWGDARTILIYIASGSEVQTEALYAKGVRPDVHMLAPSGSTYGAGRVWVAVSDRANYAATRSRADELSFPVAAVLPGVGFDERGVRLGRGGGFYDRALADLRAVGPVTAIGLAYGVQIVEKLPRDVWDQTVDIVISEARVLHGNTVSDAGRGAR